jgi:hypothetical protein
VLQSEHSDKANVSYVVVGAAHVAVVVGYLLRPISSRLEDRYSAEGMVPCK